MRTILKLNTYDAPHIRFTENTRGLMLDALITLLFLYGMAFFYYGPRALTLGLASLLAAVVCDLLCTLVSLRSPNIRDLSPLVTGLLIPLMMPASVDYHVVIAAAAFGIVVAKHPFGGVGHNVFNPAAAGYCFATICFADKLFAYPLPRTWLPVTGAIETTLTNSPVFTLGLGGIPKYEIFDEMLMGNFPGPMGATNILLVLACLLYLLLRNTIRWELPVTFFATCAVFIVLFPRGGQELGLDFMMRVRLMVYEMMSGILLLGGVYLLGDPVTTPKRSRSRVMFAVVAGVIAMLFRRYGGFEEELPFAVLLMNATVWGFDMLGERLAGRARRRKSS